MRANRARASIAAGLLAFTLIGAAAAHAWLNAPRVTRVERHATPAVQAPAAADQALVIANLRQQLATLLAKHDAPPQADATPAQRHVPSQSPHASKHARPVHVADDHGLDSIDSASGDPLHGL